jgi:hypothetical protein
LIFWGDLRCFLGFVFDEPYVNEPEIDSREGFQSNSNVKLGKSIFQAHSDIPECSIQGCLPKELRLSSSPNKRLFGKDSNPEFSHQLSPNPVIKRRYNIEVYDLINMSYIENNRLKLALERIRPHAIPLIRLILNNGNAI